MLFIHPPFYLYFQVLIKLFEKYSNLFYAVLIAQFRIKITRRRHLLGDSENTPYPADAQCKFSQSHNSITMAADVLSWPLQHIARPSVTGTDSGQVVEQVKNQLKKA